MQHQDVLGYNHVALDVTLQIQQLQQSHSQSLLGSNATLADWVSQLNASSVERFGKSLRVALEPRQQMIGRGVYELAFLYDADGCLVELLRCTGGLPQNLQSGWEPWNGEGFVGGSLV
jgi:hypothetical protein